MAFLYSPDKRGASRRACLKIIAAAAGGAAAGVGGAAAVGRLGRAPEGPWRTFTPEEARLVEAVSEQIVPADRDPGAKEAGVVVYIDRQLDGPLKRHAEKFRAGLGFLQQTAQARHGKPFEALGWPEQTRLLEDLERGSAPKEIWTGPGAKEFFNLCRDFTMQGFYGSPRHGGNRNYASYRMMGLEYPRVIGQNRYREDA
jgi:gluconate 2-dehydrogenase gamma chain